jgi:hypothetical protein
MWQRLKALWAGPKLGLEDWDEPAEAPATAAGGDPEVKAQIARIDEALAAGRMGPALTAIRALMAERVGDLEVLAAAGRGLRAAGEPELAGSLDRALTTRSPSALTDLARAFLEMGDLGLTELLVGAADQWRGGAEPASVALRAEALARQGAHHALLRLVEPWLGTWDGATVRYGLSAVLAGDMEAYARVAPLLEGDPDQGAVREAAARFDCVAQGDGTPRDASFVEYGTVLVDPRPVPGGAIAPAELCRLLAGAGEALRLAAFEPDRVAYGSKVGEVLARCLADRLGVGVMPLSARLPRQALLLIAADDAELAELTRERALADPGPLLLVQVVKDPSARGVPVADVLGCLADSATLPMAPVKAERAADRRPAPLHARQLLDAAPDAASPDGLAPWLEARRSWLSVATARPLAERVGWLGDLPDWSGGRGGANQDPLPVLEEDPNPAG